MNLIKSGIINIELEDVADVLLCKTQEEIAMSEIQIPKINSRQKGLQTQFYTTIPAKYSETGKRHQITGTSEDEVKKKFRKEARRTMTGQVDLEILQGICKLCERQHFWKNPCKESEKVSL